MIALRGGKLGKGTGFGIGEPGDPQYTISTAHEHAVVYAIDPVNFINPVLILNDQGGQVMDVSEKAGCLRAQEHGHQPVVAYPIENHAMDSRVTLKQPDEPCQTLSSRMGTGGAMCQ